MSTVSVPSPPLYSSRSLPPSPRPHPVRSACRAPAMAQQSHAWPPRIFHLSVLPVWRASCSRGKADEMCGDASLSSFLRHGRDALEGNGHEGRRGAALLLGSQHERPNDAMRAHERTLVALDARLAVPPGYLRPADKVRDTRNVGGGGSGTWGRVSGREEMYHLARGDTHFCGHARAQL